MGVAIMAPVPRALVVICVLITFCLFPALHGGLADAAAPAQQLDGQPWRADFQLSNMGPHCRGFAVGPEARHHGPCVVYGSDTRRVPQPGKPLWLAFDAAAPVTLSAVRVRFARDTLGGGCPAAVCVSEWLDGPSRRQDVVCVLGGCADAQLVAGREYELSVPVPGQSLWSRWNVTVSSVEGARLALTRVSLLGSRPTERCKPTAFLGKDGMCHTCSAACPAGTFEFVRCSATADRLCGSCRWAGLHGVPQPAACRTAVEGARVVASASAVVSPRRLAGCPAKEYSDCSQSPCVCRACATCGEGLEVSSPCSATSNTVCIGTEFLCATGVVLRRLCHGGCATSQGLFR